MEDRVRKLEARVAALEKEIRELRSALNLDKEEAPDVLLGADEEAFFQALESRGGTRVSLHDILDGLGWDDRRLGDAAVNLETAGKIELHESNTLSLSLTQMSQGIMGDDGRMFTHASLKNPS